MEDHIILICGLGSSINPKFCKWAYSLADRLGRFYELRQYTEISFTKKKRVLKKGALQIIIHIASSDFNLEKKPIKAVKKARNAGRLRRLIIGGHSNGVRDGTCKISEVFFPDTPVSYAFAIDTTLAEGSKKIFGNVTFLDEFWAGLERVNFDTSFVPKEGDNYRFHDLDQIEGKEIGHIESASLPYVQDEITRQITRVIPASAEPPIA